jgi:hypothetical protein
MGDSNRLRAREQGLISEKFRPVQILCDSRKVVGVQKHGKQRLCCYWKRYYYPENGKNMFLKECYVPTKQHRVHTTTLNPLV